MLSSKTVNWSLFGRYFGLQKQTFNGTKKTKMYTGTEEEKSLYARCEYTA